MVKILSERCEKGKLQNKSVGSSGGLHQYPANGFVGLLAHFTV